MFRFLYKAANHALNSAGLQLVLLRNTILIAKPTALLDSYRCTGIDWNPENTERLITALLPKYASEFNEMPRDTPAGTAWHGYYSSNPFFGKVDASVAYSLIRERRPSVVVEVGSGFSSRVTRTAIDKNGQGRLICIDPCPRASVDSVAHEFRRSTVEQVPLSFFQELPADAVLFIDSSHQIGSGTDGNYLFLEVLPALPPGVLIHVHDIYLPDEYPKGWNIDRGFYYTEQYLLQALLVYSTGFSVVWPGRRAVQNYRERLEPLFSPGDDLNCHCSFWLARTLVST